MRSAADRAGRTEEEWENLVVAAIDVLTQLGRTYGEKITYSELNQLLAARTGQPEFDLRVQSGRDAVSLLVAAVNDRTAPEIEAAIGHRALLSALVWLKGANDPSGGFYTYAMQHGLLSNKSREAKDEFLIRQLKLVTEYCQSLRA